MKKSKIKLFYGNDMCKINDEVNSFLKTLDYNQIDDIKISSTQSASYFVINTTILVIYTEEE